MRISDGSSDFCSADLPTGGGGRGYGPEGFCGGVRIAAAGHGPKIKSRRGRSLDLRRPDYELQERVELPARLRAQSGRFRAKASRPGCSSYGWRMTSSSSATAEGSPCSARSMACWGREVRHTSRGLGACVGGRGGSGGGGGGGGR